MTHILQEDARRRFVIALTIENTSMRLWLATRSEVLVSLPINWMTVRDLFLPWLLLTNVATYQNYRLTTEILLRLMYADETALGWDPTMKRLSPRDYVGDVQYTIECAGVTYRTVRLISDIATETIRGRGTRVWEVREVKENSEEDPTPRALKDSWVDADRLCEGKILKAIRDDAKKLSNAFDFDRYFMTAKAYDDVYIDGVKDTTYLARGRSTFTGKVDKPPLVIKAKTPRNRTMRSQAGTKGATQVPDKDVPKHVKYAAKIHHRIVFTEVGKTIAEVNTLAEALFAMTHIVKGECTARRRSIHI